jgi:hypothetical protein
LCCCGHHWIHDRPSPSPLSSTLIGLTYKVTYKAIDFFFKNFFKNGPNGKDNYLIWCKKRIKICMVEKKSRFFLFFLNHKYFLKAKKMKEVHLERELGLK